MKKSILAVILLLLSMSLAKSYKKEGVHIHKNLVQSTYINDAQNRLEHKRLLGRQLSSYFWEKNNIISMELEQEKRKNNLLANLSNN